MCVDRFFVLCLALLLPVVAQAEPVRDDAPFAVHSEELEPGGWLVVVEDHSAPLVRVRLSIPTGSHSSWWQEIHGDQLWPLASCNAEGPDHPELVDLSPWVGDRRSGWTATMLSQDADEAVISLVGCLQGEFPQGVFADKDLVRHAWASGRHSPSVQLERTIAELFFQRHDVRRRVAKRPRGVVKDAEQLEAIRDGLLAIDGWALGFAGDITVEQARELAVMLARALPDRRYGLPGWAEPATLPLAGPAGGGEPVVVEVKGAQEALLVWAREGLELTDERVAAGLLAEMVVTRRLRRALRDERGDTYALGSSGLLGVVPEPYELVVPAAPASVDSQVAVVQAELDRVATEGLDADEVERARALLRARWVGSVDTPWEALWVAMEPEDSPHYAMVQQLERSLEVPFEDVDRFAREYFAPEGFQQVRIVPKPE